MRVAWIVSGLIALLAVVAWVLTSSDAARVSPVEAHPTATHDDTSTGLVPERSNGDATALDPARDPVIAPPDAPALDRVWSTRVVDAESGQPIAGARVWLVPRALLLDAQWPGLDTIIDEPMNVLEHTTPAGTSRADGTIDIAMEPARELLCAAAPGRFGCETAGARPRTLGKSERVQVIRLFRDATLRVAVVDAGGTLRPFVPVELVAWQRGWPDGTPSLVHRVLADAATGVATISHARWRLAGGGHSSFVELRDYAVRAGVSFCSVDATKIEEKHVAGETLRLVVPPCAPIRVRLQQAERTPWPFEGVVDMRSAVPEFVPDASLPLHDGDALFAAVAVEPGLAATVRARDPRFPAIELADPGQRTPWVETLMIAQLPKPEEARPVLAGRVLDVDGAPVANTEFFVTPLVIDAYVPEYPRFTTSAIGQFEVPYADAAAPPRRAIVRTDPKRGRRAFDARDRAEFALPVPLVVGRHELGDLRLAATPLLVGGRVVTAQGVAVARVAISVELPGDPNARTTAGRMRQAFEVSTDEDGAFRSYAFEQPAVVRVSARRDSTFVPPFDVDRGRDDVVITWPTPSWIRGRLLVAASIPANKLHVNAMRTNPDDGTRTSSHCDVLEDGRFEVRVDTSESCTIQVKKPGASEVLAEVTAVTSSEDLPGEPFTPSDPRLDPLDLRGRVRLITGIVLGAADEPVESASVTEAKYGSVLTGADGRFTLLTTTPALQLSVSAKSYRTVHVTADVDELVVHLREPRTPVVARMPDGLVLDAFSAIVIWIEDPRLPEANRIVTQAQVDGQFTTLYVHDLGSYVVRVLTAPKAGVRTPVPGLAIPIEVKDAAELEVTLPITQEQLDAIAKAEK